MIDMFSLLARYNQWANSRLFEDLTALSDGDLSRPFPVNFGSVTGILNHLLLTDRLWLSRFTGKGNPPKRIDETPYPAFSDLSRERGAEDLRILAFAGALTRETLQGVLSYRNTQNVPQTGFFGGLVMHFFNQQTHHRGQVHALAGSLGLAPRDLDLGFYLIENGG